MGDDGPPMVLAQDGHPQTKELPMQGEVDKKEGPVKVAGPS